MIDELLLDLTLANTYAARRRLPVRPLNQIQSFELRAGDVWSFWRNGEYFRGRITDVTKYGSDRVYFTILVTNRRKEPTE